MNPEPPHGDYLRIQFDSQVLLGQTFMDGSELVVRARFDRALPLKVNNHSALFSLQCVVPTGVDETVNHVVKRVVVVVVKHHMPIPVQGDLGQDVFLGFNSTGGEEAVQNVSLLWCKDRRSYRLKACLCPWGSSIELQGVQGVPPVSISHEKQHVVDCRGWRSK